MAKQADPPVPKNPDVIVPAAAPAPVLTGETVDVIILNRNRDEIERITIKSADFGAKILVGSVGHVHVDEAPDGTWRFAPLAN